jgi:hypothetical protein
MDNNPYSVFGVSAPQCLGREADKARFQRLIPRNHLSMVGPRYIGKTVLARELCGMFGQRNGEITGSIYWDLGVRTPSDDADFYEQLAEVLSRGLKNASPESSNKLTQATKDHYEEIRDVFEYLHESGLCFLLCLDSFDYLFGRGVMTRNLWDNLGALADHYKSIRYLAISRRTLNELCWVPGSENSHFWKLFDTSPQLLRCLTEQDVQAAIQPFLDRGLTVGNGFVRELWNWSGGIPPLMARLCRGIWEAASDGDVVDNSTVNESARALQESADTLIPELWRSFTGDQQRLLGELGENGKHMDAPACLKPLVDAQIVARHGKILYVPSTTVL